LSLKYLLFGEDRTASKAITGVGAHAESTATKLGGVVARMGSMIGGEAGEVVDKVGTALEAAGGHHDKLGKRMLVTGGIATGAGVALMTMAGKDVEAQNQLEAAVAATGKGYEGFGEDVDKVVEKQVKFGNTDGEVKGALQKLTQSYNDPKKALSEMGLVTDLAAAKHISLGDAAGIVAKAHGGAGKIFKEFGITVGKNKDGTKDYDGALGTLSGKLTGQADAAQDSFTGKLREGKAWLDNAASSIGEKYGPAITAGGAALTILGTITDMFKTKQVAAAGATLVAAEAEGVAAGSSTLLGTAMTFALGPVGLIIIAIALLVAGLIWAYQNSETFRNVVTTALAAVGDAWTWLWNNAIAPALRFIVGGIANLLGWIANMLTALANVPGFGWAADAAKKVNDLATAANNAAAGIKNIPDHKDVTVSIGVGVYAPTPIGAAAAASANLWLRAKGGPVTAGGAYIVGEEGPEIFQPTQSGRIIPNRATGSATGGGGGSGAMVQIEHYHEGSNSPALVAAELMFRVRSA